MNLQSLKPTDEPIGNLHKRSLVQKEMDRDFIAQLVLDNNDISGLEVHKLLHEEIKRRNDNYYLSYTFVNTELRKIKNSLIQYTRDNIIEKWNYTLDIMEENIKLCQNELQNRFTERQDEQIRIEEISLADISGLTLEETMIAARIQQKAKRKTVIVRKIRAGQDFRDAAEMLLKWTDRYAVFLGLDAPKKISKKVDKEVRKVYDISELQKKAKELGFDPDKIKEILNAKK